MKVDLKPAVVLRITAGPLAGQSLTIEEPSRLVLGRALDAQLRLPEDDPTASRHHFLMEVNPPTALVRDLGSLNGTKVNDREIGKRTEVGQPGLPASLGVELADGDRVSVGATILEVELRGGAVGRTVLAPWPPPPAASPLPGAPAPVDPARALLENLSIEAKQDGSSAVETIGGYRLVKRLGQGGMGAVYLARSDDTGEEVALKVMLARAAVHPDAVRRFLREAELLAAQRHPNLVRNLDRGASGNTFWFTMELCPGGDLRSKADRGGGRIPVREALPIFRGILDGLAFMHENGFIHRDIKPENVLLDARGVPKIADFGLAKSFEETGLAGFTSTNMMAGTPQYMPREQLINFKRLMPPSDVFSIGATFYDVLAGRPPRDFPPNLDPIFVILDGDRSPIPALHSVAPDLPRGLCEIVDRSLAVDPAQRFPDARAMLRALDALR